MIFIYAEGHGIGSSSMDINSNLFIFHSSVQFSVYFQKIGNTIDYFQTNVREMMSCEQYKDL
jgi:hypothetical protein